jgi:hypothetical protein
MGLHGVDDAVQVHVDERVVVGHRHVVEPALGQQRRAAAGHPRVGEDDVERAVGIDDLVDDGAHGGRVADVELPAADRGRRLDRGVRLTGGRGTGDGGRVGERQDRLLHRVAVPVGDDHGRARLGQDRRERVAEAGRSPGDQRHLPSHVE